MRDFTGIRISPVGLIMNTFIGGKGGKEGREGGEGKGVVRGEEGKYLS